MAEGSRVVEARSRREVELLAARVRADMGLKPNDFVDMARLVDLGLTKVLEGYEMRVLPNKRLGIAEAVTDLNGPVITFSQHTYDALCRGEWRARMTAAHELGHLMMHSQRPVYLAFSRRKDPLRDPERQADIFAAAFLMPEAAFRQVTSIEEAMVKFGVSRDAASCRARKLGMFKMLILKARPSTNRKKGRKLMARTP